MKHYTLIDASGRAYITATDRKALEMMLSTESVRCSTARKEYALRGQNGTELQNLVSRLEETATNGHGLPCDRLAAAKMLATIRSRIDEDLCLVLLSWEKGDTTRSHTSKQLFFLKTQNTIAHAS